MGLNRCNYCTLQRMRDRAAERGVEVIVTREPLADAMKYGSDVAWWLARYSDEDKPAAQFALLTESCVC